jgi:type IV secretory pathway TrbD component
VQVEKMADNRSGSPERHISVDRARQGEIILRTPMRRAIFIAGLAGAVILALVLMIWPQS